MKCQKHLFELNSSEQPEFKISLQEGEWHEDESWNRDIQVSVELRLVCKNCGEEVVLSGSSTEVLYFGC